VAKSYHLHLVSDATGETTHSIARACLVQFEGIQVIEHMWPKVLSMPRLEKVMTAIEANPGAVVYTMLNESLSAALVRECTKLRVPCISVLDGVMKGLAGYFGARIRGQPGRQHVMDDEYFNRIDAMQFVLNHDDGQSVWNLKEADVVLVGVSRTSKTPTSIYLANQRGIKAANVPIVPGVPLPKELFEPDGPFVVGLTTTAENLVQIRRSRMRVMGETRETDYVDVEQVRREIVDARKLFAKMGWPVIDVSRRSIEETSAEILSLYNESREPAAMPGKHAGDG
jgi:regulator of PEP synthase PpsR (kinase-PPPase family)